MRRVKALMIGRHLLTWLWLLLWLTASPGAHARGLQSGDAAPASLPPPRRNISTAMIWRVFTFGPCGFRAGLNSVLFRMSRWRELGVLMPAFPGRNNPGAQVAVPTPSWPRERLAISPAHGAQSARSFLRFLILRRWFCPSTDAHGLSRSLIDRLIEAALWRCDSRKTPISGNK